MQKFFPALFLSSLFIIMIITINFATIKTKERSNQQIELQSTLNTLNTLIQKADLNAKDLYRNLARRLSITEIEEKDKIILP